MTLVPFFRATSRGLNAAWFGAVGDGSANDTAALQACIDFVSAAGGGELYLPAGAYPVTTLNIKTGVNLVGAGRGVTTLKYFGTPATQLLGCASGASDWSVRGVGFVGTGAAIAQSLINMVSPGSNWSVEDCSFSDGLDRSALRVTITPAIENISICRNLFSAFAKGGIVIYGAALGSQGIRINHNTFDGCGGTMCNMNSSSPLAQWDTYFDVQFNFNTIRNPTASAIHAELWGCTGLQEIGNYIDGGTRGLSAGCYSNEVVIVGNIVKNQSLYFAEMGGPAKNVVIEGNYAENCPTFLSLSSLTETYENVSVRGNTRRGSGLASYTGTHHFVKGQILTGYIKHFVVADNLDIDPVYNAGFVDLRSTQTDTEGYVEVSNNTCRYMAANCPPPKILLLNYRNVIAGNSLYWGSAYNNGHHLWNATSFIQLSNFTAGATQVISRNRIEYSGTLTGAGNIIGIGTNAGAAAFPGITIEDNVLVGNFGNISAINCPYTQGDTVVRRNDVSGVTSAGLYSLNAAIIFKDTIRVFSGTAAPTTGTWKVGDTVMDETPVVGAPVGWKCTVAGTPGTWVPLANL